MEIFSLFGSILVDNEKADRSIAATDKKAMGLGETFVKGAGMAGKFGLAVGGAALAAGAAIGGLAIKGVASADELKGAMNQLQAATGASAEETAALEETVKGVFANNFGESFEDVAASVALVKTNMGLVGEELQSATEKAYLLQDSFGFGVDETTQAVSTMMEQFGISADQAYEVIAVGAQNGANKNGDLLDVINEYSTQFADLDINAGTFMESLIEGADAGIYSMDKIGDAVKEFNIRSKDMSDTSAQAFADLGYDADEMFAAFAAGGDEANMAMQAVVEDLASMEDPLKKNEIGVSLFGTQFEDVGDDIIDVLAGLDGKLEGSEEYINDMTGTLEDMNEVRYDTLGEAVAAIGRQFEVGLLKAIQPIMPKLMEFADWIIAQMPTIMDVMGEAFIFIGDVATKATDVFVTYVLPVLTDIFDWVVAHMPEIQDFFVKAFEKIKEVTEIAIDVFNNYLKPAIQVLWDLIVAALPVVQTIFERVFGIVKTVVLAAWDIFETYFLPIIREVLKWVTEHMPEIQKVVETVFDVIQGVVNVAVDIFKAYIEIIKSVYDFVSGTFQGIGDLIMSAFGGVTDFIGGIIDKFNAVKDAIGGAITKVKDFLGLNEEAAGSVSTTPYSSYTPSYYKPGLATGGETITDGVIKVGEQGPEELFVPKGARVKPLESEINTPTTQETNVTNEFNIAQMVVREESDIKQIAKELYKMQQKNARAREVLV